MELRVRDETATGKVTHELVLRELPDRFTVRDLIRTRVREEVARHNAGQAEVFRGLVQPTDAEVDLNGYRLREHRTVDWEAQADVAEQAFLTNGFFVLVDEHQPTDLDDEIALTPDTQVSFVRLTPLVGG